MFSILRTCTKVWFPYRQIILRSRARIKLLFHFQPSTTFVRKGSALFDISYNSKTSVTVPIFQDFFFFFFIANWDNDQLCFLNQTQAKRRKLTVQILLIYIKKILTKM